MTVYELEKRSTPGPLHLAESTDSGSVSLVGQHESEEVCHTYGNTEELMLLAHCRNHFIEVLEALHRAQPRCDPSCRYSDDCDYALCQPIKESFVCRAAMDLKELIAKLEEVE